MKRILATSALALSLTTAPLSALDLDSMSDEERAAFRAEVRAYLLDNPEIIMEAVAVLEERQANAQAANDDAMIAAHAEAIFNDGFSWVGGNPDGDITLVEFVDYRCGYCRKAHDEVAELVKSDGNIKLIVKEFPILGEASVASSRFAIAIKQLHGDEAYKLAHDALITMRKDPSEKVLSKLASSFGYDGDEILARMQSEDVTSELRATQQLARALQISGTPTFVMKDELLRGYLPLEAMKSMVADKRG
ncbi:protein-disulfide isomerase [Shimia isoporae]|uniref:Protein-disulfide isomerase n=1 Tax=Shimia isoporae TaxID=647720 RepID=A0A4R1NN37_9RHOB|nr:DsbA family protein [Shimia isoporae]TCL09754.1 protein-disulfide isomerase [Shimia isoporae]